MKDVLIGTLLAVLSLFATVADAYIVLLLMFLLNTIAGLQADGGEFSFRKFTRAAQHLLVLYSVIFIVSIALMVFDEKELARAFAKYTTLLAAYFYLLNILRNATIILPFSRSVRMLYRLLSTDLLRELLMRIPIVSRRRAEELTKEINQDPDPPKP